MMRLCKVKFFLFIVSFLLLFSNISSASYEEVMATLDNPIYTFGFDNDTKIENIKVSFDNSLIAYRAIKGKKTNVDLAIASTGKKLLEINGDFKNFTISPTNRHFATVRIDNREVGLNIYSVAGSSIYMQKSFQIEAEYADVLWDRFEENIYLLVYERNFKKIHIIKIDFLYSDIVWEKEYKINIKINRDNFVLSNFINRENSKMASVITNKKESDIYLFDLVSGGLDKQIESDYRINSAFIIKNEVYFNIFDMKCFKWNLEINSLDTDRLFFQISDSRFIISENSLTLLQSFDGKSFDGKVKMFDNFANLFEVFDNKIKVYALPENAKVVIEGKEITEEALALDIVNYGVKNKVEKKAESESVSNEKSENFSENIAVENVNVAEEPIVKVEDSIVNDENAITSDISEVAIDNTTVKIDVPIVSDAISSEAVTPVVVKKEDSMAPKIILLKPEETESLETDYLLSGDSLSLMGYILDKSDLAFLKANGEDIVLKDLEEFDREFLEEFGYIAKGKLFFYTYKIKDGDENLILDTEDKYANKTKMTIHFLKN